MKKKSFIALSISVLTFGSLILALVFSPLRTYYADNSIILDGSKAISGVDLGSKIKNARSLSSYQNFTGSFLNIPSTSSKLLSKNGLHSNGSSNLNEGSGDFSVINSSNSVAKSANGIAMNSDGTSASGNKSNNFTGGFVNSSFLASNNDTKKSSTSSNKGFISTTSNLTSLQKSGTTKSNANGGPPPDGTGDIPPNLPIGNGMLFMLGLAGIFGLLKFRKI
jgi:hypothetical protein